MLAHRVYHQRHVARAKRINNALVLFKRALHPVAHPQLQAPIGPQFALQRLGLLTQEGVVGGCVERAVKSLVGVEVGVRIALVGSCLAALVHRQQGAHLVLADAAYRQSGAHGFEFGHYLEHLDQPLRRGLRHHRTPARTHLHQTLPSELAQRLANRRARYTKAPCQLHLIEVGTGLQAAGGHLLFDRFTQLFGQTAHGSILCSAHAGFCLRMQVDVISTQQG